MWACLRRIMYALAGVRSEWNDFLYTGALAMRGHPGQQSNIFMQYWSIVYCIFVFLEIDIRGCGDWGSKSPCPDPVILRIWQLKCLPPLLILNSFDRLKSAHVTVSCHRHFNRVRAEIRILGLTSIEFREREQCACRQKPWEYFRILNVKLRKARFPGTAQLWHKPFYPIFFCALSLTSSRWKALHSVKISKNMGKSKILKLLKVPNPHTALLYHLYCW